jgi:hypothetical protein
MFIIPIIVFILSIVGYLLYKAYSLKFFRKWATIKWKGSFSQWDDLFQREFAVYPSFSTKVKQKFLKKVAIFLSEKYKIKSDPDPEQLLCAAKACLPLVNRKANFYPQLHEDFDQFGQEEWFEQNFKQFEIELGKLAARDFQHSFGKDSYTYFYERESEKILGKNKFDLLKRFYNYPTKAE